jgi:hypothetical protein
MAFAENASFKSSGVICWSPSPLSLLGELSMDKRDSNGLILSTRKVCMVSHGSNKTIGTSLVVAHWKISFLAALHACYKLGGRSRGLQLLPPPPIILRSPTNLTYIQVLLINNRINRNLFTFNHLCNEEK